MLGYRNTRLPVIFLFSYMWKKSPLLSRKDECYTYTHKIRKAIFLQSVFLIEYFATKLCNITHFTILF